MDDGLRGPYILAWDASLSSDAMRIYQQASSFLASKERQPHRAALPPCFFGRWRLCGRRAASRPDSAMVNTRIPVTLTPRLHAIDR